VGVYCLQKTTSNKRTSHTVQVREVRIPWTGRIIMCLLSLFIIKTHTVSYISNTGVEIFNERGDLVGSATEASMANIYKDLDLYDCANAVVVIVHTDTFVVACSRK